MIAPRPGYAEAAESVADDRLVRVTDHVYRSARGEASTWIVISDSGKALAIDYGYRLPHMWPGYPIRATAVPFFTVSTRCANGSASTGSTWCCSPISTTTTSTPCPCCSGSKGTRCWAGRNFAHLVADPDYGNFPCTWPEPIEVEPQPLDAPVRWEEYAFVLHPMSGHTRWSTIVAFEADGRAFAATGDQYFFWDASFTDFANRDCMHNHVYRNGAALHSFRASNERMRALRPDIILPGHGDAYATASAFFDALDRYAAEYEEAHRRLLPLGEDEAHFEVDARAGWLTPYRTRLDRAAPIRYTATVRNPLPEAAECRVRLVAPPGWKAGEDAAHAEARGEVEIPLELVPPEGTVCRRQPVAIGLTVAGRPFGQVAEALVTIGHPRF